MRPAVWTEVVPIPRPGDITGYCGALVEDVASNGLAAPTPEKQSLPDSPHRGATSRVPRPRKGICLGACDQAVNLFRLPRTAAPASAAHRKPSLYLVHLHVDPGTPSSPSLGKQMTGLYQIDGLNTPWWRAETPVPYPAVCAVRDGNVCGSRDRASRDNPSTWSSRSASTCRSLCPLPWDSPNRGPLCTGCRPAPRREQVTACWPWRPRNPCMQVGALHAVPALLSAEFGLDLK